MTLAALLNQPVTITRRIEGTTKDEFRNVIPDEDTVSTVGELQQRSRSEPGADGETSTADFLLILPAGTDLTTADKVTVDGQDYEVVGDPWRARNPRSQTYSHIEATVRRTAGGGDEGAS